MLNKAHCVTQCFGMFFRARNPQPFKGAFAFGDPLWVYKLRKPFAGKTLWGHWFILGLLPQWLNRFYFFWLVFPLKMTKTNKFKLFLLGKLTK